MGAKVLLKNYIFCDDAANYYLEVKVCEKV